MADPLAEMLGGEGDGAEMDMGSGADTSVDPLPMDDFGMAISEAFPDNTWTPEKLDAMKEAIRLCLDEDKAGGYDDAASGGKPKGDDALALIFEGPPAKKK